jgi:hypothetical protein
MEDQLVIETNKRKSEVEESMISNLAIDIDILADSQTPLKKSKLNADVLQ